MIAVTMALLLTLSRLKRAAAALRSECQRRAFARSISCRHAAGVRFSSGAGRMRGWR